MSPQNNNEEQDPALNLPLQSVTRDTTETKSAFSKVVAFARRIRFVPVVMIIFAMGGIVGLYFQPPGLRFIFATFGLEPGAGSGHPIAVPPTKPTNENRLVTETNRVVGLGTVLPIGDIIVINLPHGEGDARIASINVKEGDKLKAGQVVATLDSATQQSANLELAKATYEARLATLQQIRASVQASIRETSAALKSAQAKAENAVRAFNRTQKLVEQKVVSQSVLDERRAARDDALAAVSEARASLSRYEMTNIDEQPDVQVAARNVDVARAEVRRASLDLEMTQITSPVAATVLDIKASPGERPGSEGIMVVGNLDQMIVEAEIYETEVGRLTVGNPAQIISPAFKEPLTGSVSSIGLQVGRQQRTGDEPAANTDARVVKVKIALDDKSSERARKYTGLQVTAFINVEKKP